MKKYLNTYKIKENTGILIISKDKNIIAEVLIDIEDINKINKYSWRMSDKGYIITDIKRKKKKLHNIILNRETTNSKLVCDHINRNKLDNRKINLRIVTQKENNLNRENIINAKYYYYRKDRNKYYVPGIGYFNTEQEAKEKSHQCEKQ